MLTMHLSVTESINYAALRTSLRAAACKFARNAGKRFAQVVASDGRIVDVLEIHA